jgi:hypothetical protein
MPPGELTNEQRAALIERFPILGRDLEAEDIDFWFEKAYEYNAIAVDTKGMKMHSPEQLQEKVKYYEHPGHNYYEKDRF